MPAALPLNSQRCTFFGIEEVQSYFCRASHYRPQYGTGTSRESNGTGTYRTYRPMTLPVLVLYLDYRTGTGTTGGATKHKSKVENRVLVVF
jgi:hypothetical protein